MAEFHIDSDILTQIKGKTVLITGGSSGIGYTTAKPCLDLGAKVIAGDIAPPKENLPGSSDANFFFLQTDVSNWSSIRDLFIQGQNHFGAIDHVFANAGIAPQAFFLKESFDEEGLLTPPDLTTLNVNLIGVINTVRLAAYYLPKNGNDPRSKSIVLNSSAACFKTFSAADYAAAKHGVLGILRGMTVEIEPIARINAVSPSWTATAMGIRDILEGLGATVQDSEAVAKSVLLLFADSSRHGELIYSFDGRYFEVNKAEGGLLDAASKFPSSAVSDDVVIRGLIRLMQSNAESSSV